MANFELSKKIKLEKELNTKDIKDFIREELSKTCKYQVVVDSGDTFSVKGSVKEKILTPVTKFEVSFNSKVEGDRARINMNGKSTVNFIFWILFIVGLAAGAIESTLAILWVVGVVLFLFQRKKPKETCEGIINAIDTEFGTI